MMLHPRVLLSCTQLSDASAPLTTNIEQIKNLAGQRFIDLSPSMAKQDSASIAFSKLHHWACIGTDVGEFSGSQHNARVDLRDGRFVSEKT